MVVAGVLVLGVLDGLVAAVVLVAAEDAASLAPSDFFAVASAVPAGFSELPSAAAAFLFDPPEYRSEYHPPPLRMKFADVI